MALSNEPASSAQPSPANGGSQAPSYVIRLWRGEIALPVTYWLVAVGGSFAVGIASYLLLLSDSLFTLALVIAGSIVWSVYIAVAVFRSGAAYARRYPKRRWGRIAQGLACVGLLANTVRVVHLVPGYESTAELDQAAAIVNRGAGKMITERLRFDTVHRQDRMFVLSFTILGPTHVFSPQEIAAGRTRYLRQACANSDLRRVLRSVDKLRYEFTDSAWHNLMTFDIAYHDCA